jgi:hypothetical protein
MLYSEIIAVYSQIHPKHINTLCGQNVELVNYKTVYRFQLAAQFRTNRNCLYALY